MVSINYSSREVCCKIVYYGPGLSGKTTNLLYVHSKVPTTSRGKMISLATEADRTLYFDFLPINIGTINGFAAKFQLYTVPGQVYYNATRKLVLRGVDGVVFVADSQPDKMEENLESLSNLEENLVEYGYDINDLPIVIQYNKCDLPGILSKEELEARLNPRKRPSFMASATVGTGVFDTLKMIIKLVLDKAKSTASGQGSSATPKVTTPQPEPAQSNSVLSASSMTPGNSVSSAPSAAASVAPSASTATATMSPPQTEEEEQIRPFPGGTTGPINLKNTSYTPSTATETDNQSAVNQKMLNGDDNKPKDGVNDMSTTPTMAPSLKRRNEKKRGFFKRLFGKK